VSTQPHAKTLSVIIVSWNAKAFLLECLASVLAQDVDAAIEIIVVDNASTDGSPDAVAAAFPTVKVIRNTANYGFARANNIGIRASTGDYLFLINSDVVVLAHCFRRMVRYLDGHPEIGMLGPRITGADGEVQRSCMGYPSLWNTLTRALALDIVFPGSKLVGGQLLTFWRHDQTRAVEVINGCFWAVTRRALNQVGLLDERYLIYGEDIDWCRRFNQRGWKVVFYPEAAAIHYGGASSANAPTRFYVEMQRATCQYWLKHHSRAAAAAFVSINILHHVVRIAGEAIAYPWMPQRRRLAGPNIARAYASIKWAAATMISIGAPARLAQGTGEQSQATL
jgi:GT2 family glycosyltransferase